MSKKNRNQNQQFPPAAQACAQAPAGSPPGTEPQEASEPPKDASSKHLLFFWSIIALSAAAAWILAAVMPGVSESVIERWIMAAMAVSLAVLLFVYR